MVRPDSNLQPDRHEREDNDRGIVLHFRSGSIALLRFDEVVSRANWCGDGVAHGDERGLAFEAKLLDKRTEGMVCLVKIALGLRQVRVVRQGATMPR
jgi:hypothetical protein